jgi:hypothetical protein
MWERLQNAITSISELCRRVELLCRLVEILCRLVEIYNPQGEYAEIGQS